MAFNIDSTMELIGSLRQEIWTRNYLKMSSIKKQMGTVLPNIKGKITLPNLSITPNIILSECEFRPTAVFDSSARILETAILGVHHEICYKKLEQWDATYGITKAEPGVQNSKVLTYMDAMIKLFLKSTPELNETYYWQAVKALIPNINQPLTGFNGAMFYINQATVNRTGPALTAANIANEIIQTFIIAPETMLREDSTDQVYIGLSVQNQRLLQASFQNVAALDISGFAYNQATNEISYFGIPVKSSHGIPNNRIFMIRPNNLFIGTDLEGDLENINIVDNKPTKNELSISYRMDYALGAQVNDLSQMVVSIHP